MTKKAQAKQADALNQIGSLILTLTRTYPRQAARYQAARADEQRWGAIPMGHSLFPLSDERRHKAAQLADRYREICQRTQEQIPILAQLVASYFPEDYRDLKTVRFYADIWHEKPIDEWEPLLSELASIEAAALRAAPSLQSTEPSKRRGVKPKQLEDDLATLREREGYATDSEYEKASGRKKGYMSHLRKRAERNAGGPEELKKLLSQKPRQ